MKAAFGAVYILRLSASNIFFTANLQFSNISMMVTLLQTKPLVITKQEQSVILGLWSYFDDGCNLLSHHRALQSEPPHLQKQLKDLKIMSTKHTIRNYTAVG